MLRQNIMAFASVKLVLLGVLLVQVASARYVLGKDGVSNDGSPFQSLAGGAGPKAAERWLNGRRSRRNADGYGGLGYEGLVYGGYGVGSGDGYGHGVYG